MGKAIGTGRRGGGSSNSIPEKIAKQLGCWFLDDRKIHLIQRNPREESKQRPQQEKLEPVSSCCRSGRGEGFVEQARLRNMRLDALTRGIILNKSKDYF